MKSNNLFEKQVRLALSNFKDAAWLGEHSPLATPYFLGRHLSDTDTDFEMRGDQLKKLLFSAASELWGGPPPQDRETLVTQAFEARDRDGSKCGKFGFLLLELYFFRKYFPSNLYPSAKVEPIVAYTASSRTRFFGYLNHFVPMLATSIKKLAQPGFRLENPARQGELIGRKAVFSASLYTLRNGKPVSLNGAGGMGKTSLGIELASAWPSSSFWYTIRPGLNDNLYSLLFSVAHFLNQQGQSSLWLQLLASNGKSIEINLALGSLREDLAGLESPALFCFDETDLLGNIDGRTAEQQAVVELLDALKALTPMLLIGQSALIDTAEQVTLTGLTSADCAELLTRNSLSDQTVLAEQVFSWTRGNPRFIELVGALLKREAKTAEIEKLMGNTPAGRPIVERLWKRLTATERKILGYLSVFRRETPIDPFLHLRGELNHLAEIGIVAFDARHNLMLSGMLGRWIVQMIQPEQLEIYHQDAAVLFAERGDFTESAWHFNQNLAFEEAVTAWYPHREAELLRGNADAARQIFQSISLNKVGKKTKEKLKVIRAELNLLLGSAEQIVNETEIAWSQSEEKAIYLRTLADAHFMLGNHDTADKLCAEGLETLAELSQSANQIRLVRLAINFREGELESAESGVLQAEYQSNLMRSLLLDHKGDLDDAARFLQSALEIAEQLEDGDAIAKTKRELAINFGRRGDLVNAEYYSNEAMGWYQKKGDRLSLEGTRANLAGMFLQTGEFEKVIGYGEKSLKYFEQIKNENWIASLACNLAEAHFELGDLGEAEAFAQRALRFEDTFIQPHALYTLGLIEEKEGRFAQANQIFLQGLEIADQTGDRFISAYLHRVLGSLYGKMGSAADGVRHLTESGRLFGEMSLDGEAETSEQLLNELQPMNA